MTYARDRQTARDVCGVRLPPAHTLSKSVHAHRTWLSDSVALTWCDIEADMSNGASQTTDTITCSGCGENSWKNTQRWHRSVRWFVARQVAP